MEPDLAVERAWRWQWDAPTSTATAGFTVMTAVAVIEFVRAAPLFERIFKELGVRVPMMTEVVQMPWVHLVAGVVLAVPLVLRHHEGWKTWATTVWIVGLLTYIACSHVALFEPLIRLIDDLGKSS